MRYPATAGATTPIMLAAQLVIPSKVPAKLDAMSRWTHLADIKNDYIQDQSKKIKAHMNPAY